jgi:hypothetical protein
MFRVVTAREGKRGDNWSPDMPKRKKVNPPMGRRLVDEPDAAVFLDTTVGRLKQNRYRPTFSLPWVRVGTAVRYDLADLEQFIREHRVVPQVDETPSAGRGA